MSFEILAIKPIISFAAVVLGASFFAAIFRGAKTGRGKEADFAEELSLRKRDE